MTSPEMAGVEVDGLTVRYGGKTAVDGLSLAAPLGRVTGLIGPNGAGKTTTFGAVSGLVPPAAGTVRLFGQAVSRRSAAARARLGLGRTFQRPELCPSLTVMDNVALGCEALAAGGNVWRQIVPRRNETARLREQAVLRVERDRRRLHAEGAVVGREDPAGRGGQHAGQLRRGQRPGEVGRQGQARDRGNHRPGITQPVGRIIEVGIGVIARSSAPGASAGRFDRAEVGGQSRDLSAP